MFLQKPTSTLPGFTPTEKSKAQIIDGTSIADDDITDSSIFL